MKNSSHFLSIASFTGVSERGVRVARSFGSVPNRALARIEYYLRTIVTNCLLWVNVTHVVHGNKI